MKFVLVVAFLLVCIWLWRSGRPVAPPHKPSRPAADHEPQDMVSCALCRVHVPSGDALQGKKGLYCCAEHLKKAEY